MDSTKQYTSSRSPLSAHTVRIGAVTVEPSTVGLVPVFRRRPDNGDLVDVCIPWLDEVGYTVLISGNPDALMNASKLIAAASRWGAGGGDDDGEATVHPLKSV